jgi:hypothetical protein
MDPMVEPMNVSGRLVVDNVIRPINPTMLNTEQRRAYDIILWHLDQTLAGRKPPPLRLIIHGEGGAGKSKVLQTVNRDRGIQTTGVWATLIEIGVYRGCSVLN